MKEKERGRRDTSNKYNSSPPTNLDLVASMEMLTSETSTMMIGRMYPPAISFWHHISLSYQNVNMREAKKIKIKRRRKSKQNKKSEKERRERSTWGEDWVFCTTHSMASAPVKNCFFFLLSPEFGSRMPKCHVIILFHIALSLFSFCSFGNIL